MPAIHIKRLPHGEGLPVPSRATAGSSGFDLHAALGAPCILAPGNRELVPTGFAFQIPSGYELQIRSRSGLAARQGIMVLNSPGTIDSDYRGEVKVILINLGDKPCTIKRGDRIAQAVVGAVFPDCALVECDSLEETARGSGGFGHTGT